MLEGHIAERIFGDRRAGVTLITYGRARIVVGRVDNLVWYEDVW